MQANNAYWKYVLGKTSRIYILDNAIQQHSLTSLGDMDEVQKVFNKFDTNSDGKISVSELHSVFKALSVDVGTSSTDRTDVVTEIDKDGDCAIDLEEFADLHRCGGSKSNNDKARTFKHHEHSQTIHRDNSPVLASTSADHSPQ
ncbi:hypothetical protein RHSIM_Rhsim05G0120300 [Rhododendron simsii]|uniref:EF-hand domain-containing protein n=1 Tax=Rhododendron simsii TaxID=118357 RepID=A0A834LN02_RHOSS|nr:hypothetical protein RHSIM_Rhsim05G0120300 [Rhododendron simsii]